MHCARAAAMLAMLALPTSSCGRVRWRKPSAHRTTSPVHAPYGRPPVSPVLPLPSATPSPTLTAAPTTATTTSAPPIGPPPPPAPCTDRFGHALTPAFGRLDGLLVALVPPRTPRCKSDERHLHLQLEVDGEAYDVAVPLGDPATGDVLFKEVRAPVPGGPWRAGWSPGLSLDYVRTFSAHAADFVVLSRDDLLRQLQMELVTKRRVSVWGTGYGPGGVHEVHRSSAQHDGTIALDPDSPRSRFLLFRFARQRF